MKKVSVIIPTRNKLTRLLIVLRALEMQIDSSIEVIVIFDGCDKKEPLSVNKAGLNYEPVMLVLPRNVGRSEARNRGILKARGEIIIFLDDDRIPCPDFIQMHLAIHQEERCAVIGKRYNIEYKEDIIRKAAYENFSHFDFQNFTRNAIKEKYDFIKVCFQKILGNWLNRVTFTTGNSSVRREDLLAVGMFDNNYSGWGVEDVDLGYRLSQYGIKIRREYSLPNYHLSHPVNLSNQKKEYWKNFDYFSEKIKNDKPALWIAHLVNIFSPYN